MFSYLGNYLGFQGYYNPFSGEGQVNTTIPRFLEPFVTAHEVAHQIGYAKENEANFAGFLACRSYPSNVFRYSMYLDMYNYALGEVYRRDTSLARSFQNKAHPQIIKDQKEFRDFYRRYNNPVEDLIMWGYGHFLKANNTLKLIIAIAIPLIVGGTSGFFTATGVESWYQTIARPTWNPPGWLFGPVWTTLYVMMGISLFLVWKEDTSVELKKIGIALFAVQLVLNFFWSFIFFNQHQIGWALVEIAVMWVFILLTIFAFAQVNKAAAWLLVPYISWVSFATILNYTTWQLNK